MTVMDSIDQGRALFARQAWGVDEVMVSGHRGRT